MTMNGGGLLTSDSTTPENVDIIIPVIDLSMLESEEKRDEIVNQTARACRELGFFQIVNHGIPLEKMDRMIKVIKDFHNLPMESKLELLSKKSTDNVSLNSNFDTTSYPRNTLRVLTTTSTPEAEDIPEICRNEIVEWLLLCKQLGEVLMGVLFNGVGLEYSSKLKDMKLLDGYIMGNHSYPSCPKSNFPSFGIQPHADPGVLTILLQDDIGGLQVKCDGKWVDVKPVKGALVVNISNLLQIIVNDKYKSAEHRVLTNHYHEPRISIAILFLPFLNSQRLFGSLEELATPEKPSLYRQFTIGEYMTTLYTKDVSKNVTDCFRI